MTVRLPAGAVVHVVDDDAAIRDALCWLMASRGLATRDWASGEDFLASLSVEACSCIILDVRLDGMNGPEIFDRLRATGCAAPVIFLTGHADVPIAVQALKRGAFDFVEKPFNDNQIVDLALAALASHAAQLDRAQNRAELAERLAALSSRETEVLRLILKGQLNKQIADELDIAMRTVEVHRARILAKMGARNALDLAAQLAAVQLTIG